jgi:hypothetical protein
VAKQITTLADLVQDDRNANAGTARGREMVERSLHKLGAGRSILVDRNGKIIAGNKTHEAAAAIALDNPIVVQRTDLDMDEDTAARELAIVDNRAGETGLEWDTSVLAGLGENIDLSQFWTRDELSELLDDASRTLDLNDPQGGSVEAAYNVMVECASEDEQQRAYSLLTAEGFSCRVLTL